MPSTTECKRRTPRLFVCRTDKNPCLSGHAPGPNGSIRIWHRESDCWTLTADSETGRGLRCSWPLFSSMVHGSTHYPFLPKPFQRGVEPTVALASTLRPPLIQAVRESASSHSESRGPHYLWSALEVIHSEAYQQRCLIPLLSLIAFRGQPPAEHLDRVTLQIDKCVCVLCVCACLCECAESNHTHTHTHTLPFRHAH